VALVLVLVELEAGEVCLQPGRVEEGDEETRETVGHPQDLLETTTPVPGMRDEEVVQDNVVAVVARDQKMALAAFRWLLVDLVNALGQSQGLDPSRHLHVGAPSMISCTLIV
jgi:hypothetical protein